MQASRRSADVASFTDRPPRHRRRVWTAQRLIQIPSGQGIRSSAAGFHPEITTSGSFVVRIDHALPPLSNASVPRPSWWLNGYAQYSHSDALSLSPTSTPAFTGARSSAVESLQGSYSRYFSKEGDYVNETTSAFSFSDARGTPYLQLPSGNGLVASTLTSAATTFAALGFGGNSSLATDNEAWGWELDNQTALLIRGKASLAFKV